MHRNEEAESYSKKVQRWQKNHQIGESSGMSRRRLRNVVIQVFVYIVLESELFFYILQDIVPTFFVKPSKNDLVQS